MKKRGSCGLKQARYEISCRLCAARWRLVQNSFTNVGTRTTRPSGRSAAAVTVSTVAPMVPPVIAHVLQQFVGGHLCLIMTEEVARSQ